MVLRQATFSYVHTLLYWVGQLNLWCRHILRQNSSVVEEVLEEGRLGALNALGYGLSDWYAKSGPIVSHLDE